MPTKVSQLENDANYLTEHQSLDGLATEQYVDDAIADIDIQDSYYMDFTAAASTETECDAEMTKFCETVLNGGDACAYIKDAYDGYYYPTVASIVNNRIILTKCGVNLNNIAASYPIKWDTINLIYTDKWYYTKLGQNEATFVTSANVDKKVSEAMTDYALKEEIPSLEGLATEEYVNTAVSNVSCITETIKIQNITDTNTLVDSDASLILDRISKGEHFPICLTKNQQNIFPTSIAYDSSSVNMILDLNIRPTGNGTYLDTASYKFEKSSNQWYGHYNVNSYLVRGGNN